MSDKRVVKEEVLCKVVFLVGDWDNRKDKEPVLE